MIDLRSDTVTLPSEDMRRAMAGAEVGDDVYGEDPTVNRLEELSAGLFGREAGLFVPSGTMGNAVCLDVHCEPGGEVICDRLGHVYNYELASMAVLSGLTPRVLDGPGGAVTAEQVKAAIHPPIYYLSPTCCVSLENTANMAGGKIFPSRRWDEVVGVAHEHGIPVHLDGARIFNAAVAAQESVEHITRGADSVMFSLSKGLGAPVGSVVVGSGDFIRRARRVRKRFGGGMRQAGIIAAAGIFALEHNIERLAGDHENAGNLADGLAGLDGIEADPEAVETNILMVRTGDNAPRADELCRRLEDRGVRIDPLGPDLIRLVTHLDISARDIGTVIEAFAAALRGD